MPPRSPGPKNELGYYLSMSQVGFEMVVPIAVGMMLDRYLGWMPWATVGGAVLGFVGGVLHLVLLSRSADAADSSQPPREGP